MARKLRIEYPGARYHVINRGNYRGDIFAEEGARRAFLGCLFEACQKAGWVLHAYVLMSNHYHLALETPEANLVEGMRWLQSTFSNRFNRFRGESGHVFQGRYKALLVEDAEAMGAVAHYIHLNPVRAKLLPVERLVEYEASSYRVLFAPKKRPACLRVEDYLRAAGDLADTATGRKKYGEYLAWLAENEPARKQLKFERMSKGWALGSVAFKKALVADHKQLLADTGRKEMAVREAKEMAWADALGKAMRIMGKSEADAQKEPKSAAWKIAIAGQMKAKSTVTNVWLARELNMGTPEGVSRYVSEHRQGKRRHVDKHVAAIANIMV